MHEHLTNETLRKAGLSPFQLTAEAIAIAQHKIAAGKEVSLSKIVGELRQHHQQPHAE